jgi:hypothetical protein
LEKARVKYFCGEQKVAETKWQTPSKNEHSLEMRKRGDQRQHMVVKIKLMKDAKRMGWQRKVS